MGSECDKQNHLSKQRTEEKKNTATAANTLYLAQTQAHTHQFSQFVQIPSANVEKQTAINRIHRHTFAM